jgi:uncharacterized repeat protein (TIGR03803 family)
MRLSSKLSIHALAVATLCVSAFAVTEATVHNFVTFPNGAMPQGAFVADAAGNLYTTTQYGGSHNQGAVVEFTATSSGWTEHVLYNFLGQGDGAQPIGGMVFDAAGNLYGTAFTGNYLNAEYGTVFELSPTSNGAWTFKTIHTFGDHVDGRAPSGSLTIDSTGNLYGTTQTGGTHDSGTVFEVSPTSSGWSESVLYSFDYRGGDGIIPQNGVILDGKGNLYGTTSYGPHGYSGTVFELSPSGSGFVETILHSFAYNDGRYPTALVFDKAGNLYGTAAAGGLPNFGTVFELVASKGWEPVVLHTFTGGTDGTAPNGGVAFDSAGNLYGTTGAGGIGTCGEPGQGCGTVYELSPSAGSWTKTILHNFTGGADGSNPGTPVLVDSAGNVYGTTLSPGPPGMGLITGGTIFKLTPSSGTWTESVLDLNGTDGKESESALVADSAGNFYGTTTYGGTNDLGAVFEVSPAANGKWTEKLLYSFSGTPDGELPYGKLVLDQSGNLYGTASGGGTSSCACGAVFKLSPASGGKWSEQILYSFAGYPNDGNYPLAGLTIDGSGNLFGTTNEGGSANAGTAFEVYANAGAWSETVIHSFGSITDDGGYPRAELIFDASGNLYGTTYSGGSGQQGGGTVFELSPASGGWTETILYGFNGEADGGNPTSSVTFDKAGALFGTTVWGGTGTGVVYRLQPTSSGKWLESVLYTFGASSTDAQRPLGNVNFDAFGNLYGTTAAGGASTLGTVFELAPGSSTWSETILHSFNGNDGQQPYAGLLMDAAGNIYGTTASGGSGNAGNVFEVTP